MKKQNIKKLQKKCRKTARTISFILSYASREKETAKKCYACLHEQLLLAEKELREIVYN